MMEGGRMWFFGGNQADAMLTISAQTYNGMWREWGLSTRPDEFDDLVAERWGIPLAPWRNPYPLPGEDPNATDGGSGQLPAALTQLRDEQGRYLGEMSFNCHWCHSGKVGDASEGSGLGTLYGSGNSLLDVSAGFSKFFDGLTGLVPVVANKVRGTGDILLYPAIAALDVDRAQHYNESLVAAPAQGSVDYPAWWNAGHRTRRFHDGSFAMDDARPVMGFFMPLFTRTNVLDLQHGRAWIDERAKDVQLWLESLRAPAYPGPIDRTLAEAGALIFHSRDLFAAESESSLSRPAGGNGSCATCHGVYAPRFVQDPAYLERPELEGLAAYVVPIDLIDTDPARYASLNEGLRETLRWSWWSYGTNDAPGACFGPVEQGGYLAPPLYGVWATAPYFHNGSVPNVWGVLAPHERPKIWRRVSAPAPAALTSAFMGFDTNLARAYDHQRLGWRYEELACGDPVLEPALDCTAVDSEANPAAEALRAQSFDDVWFSWNIAPQPQDARTLEERKIYNTHKYSQGNYGHDFTAVLTDGERRALVEYLKTL
jgi:mono/diheme cytochrome c family protein